MLVQDQNMMPVGNSILPLPSECEATLESRCIGRVGCSPGGIWQQSQLWAAAAAVHGARSAAQRQSAGA